MADTKISALATLAASAIAAGDWMPVVDVSDTTMAASGTTKKTNAANICPQFGAWPEAPAITGAGSSPTISYSGQGNYYARFGALIYATFQITINTISGGSGVIRISLPFVAANVTQGPGLIRTTGVALPTGAVNTFLLPTPTAQFGTCYVVRDNASLASIDISMLGAGDVIQGGILYISSWL